MPCINCDEQNVNSLTVITADCVTLTIQSDMFTDLANAEITEVNLVYTNGGTTTEVNIEIGDLVLVDTINSYQIVGVEGVYEFTLLADYTACPNVVKESIKYFNVCDALKCKIINSIIDCPDTTVSQAYDILNNAQYCDGVTLTDMETIYNQLLTDLTNIEKNNPCTTC